MLLHAFLSAAQSLSPLKNGGESKGSSRKALVMFGSSPVYVTLCSVRLNSESLDEHQQVRLARHKPPQTLIPLPLEKNLFCYINWKVLFFSTLVWPDVFQILLLYDNNGAVKPSLNVVIIQLFNRYPLLLTHLSVYIQHAWCYQSYLNHTSWVAPFFEWHLSTSPVNVGFVCMFHLSHFSMHPFIPAGFWWMWLHRWRMIHSFLWLVNTFHFCRRQYCLIFMLEQVWTRAL